MGGGGTDVGALPVFDLTDFLAQADNNTLDDKVSDNLNMTCTK